MDQELAAAFFALYQGWAQAIRDKNWMWFERHFAPDWLGTARPWPALALNRSQLIEIDKQIESLDAEWVDVRPHRLGDSVVTVAVARIGNEEFRPGGHLAEGVATTKEFKEYCAGQTIAYAGAWRYEDGWQMYDHRLIGAIAGYNR